MSFYKYESYLDTYYRKCSICYEYAIPSGEPKWKTKCLSCLIREPKRLCVNCLKQNIPITDPRWKTVCTECYKNRIM